jgi:hypothetical protein
MLYQWEVGKVSMFEVGQTFWTGRRHRAARDDLRPSRRSWRPVWRAGRRPRSDDGEAAENWRLERMNVLDRLILRLAVYEFLHEPETPAKVDHQRGAGAGAYLQHGRLRAVHQRRSRRDPAHAGTRMKHSSRNPIRSCSGAPISKS